MTISGAGLFFEDQFSTLASFLTYDDLELQQSNESLRIAYLFAPRDLNPFSPDPSTQTRLLDVYEPLIRIDDSFNVQPVLTLYYGLLDENTWELRLRTDVKFHDGSSLDVSDVIYSYDQAQSRPSGVAADLINSTESLEKYGEHGLKLTTKKPDPLLLSKLSKLLIIPDGYDDFDQPIGTGPYKLIKTDRLSQLGYMRNDGYWGNPAYFAQVQVLSIPDKNERVEELYNGNVDLLVNVPPDAVSRVEDKNFKIQIMPSLEVGFVMFNMRNKTFAQKEARMAVAKGLNRDSFLDLAFGFAKTVNQFVPNGVFGYDPDLQGFAFDEEEAHNELLSLLDGDFQKVRVSFSFPQSLKLLGEYFSEQLTVIGMELNLIPLSDLELQEQLVAKKLGFYYLGWRHESGDALPFLKMVLHSSTSDGYGVYNGMNYKNEQVDALIQKSEINFNLQERLEDMQEVMRIVVEEDVVGVPLFETQSIFASAPDLLFKPRVDSLVFPSSIRRST